LQRAEKSPDLAKNGSLARIERAKLPFFNAANGG